VGFEPTVRY